MKFHLQKQNLSGIYGSGTIENQKVILLKPQTFMNLSGQSIVPTAQFYKIPIQNIIVIYDDMDTEVGEIRIRKKGGAGSHNGAKSVVEELNSEDFIRIRVGIGKPVDQYDAIDYVIGPINDKMYTELQKGIDKAVGAVEEFLKNGIDTAMNKYN